MAGSIFTGGMRLVAFTSFFYYRLHVKCLGGNISAGDNTLYGGATPFCVGRAVFFYWDAVLKRESRKIFPGDNIGIMRGSNP